MSVKGKYLTFLLIGLFIFGSMPMANPVSAEEEIDNWPVADAWLNIELVSWIGNETVEWDNNGGLPDPQFKICVSADGIEIGCVNSPTWQNTLFLSNNWNTTIDVPDSSKVLTIEVECEDDDAINDDECDLDSRWDYWKLTREYIWAENQSFLIEDDGSLDIDDSKKNAYSKWKLEILSINDEDRDGVADIEDLCPNTKSGALLDNNTTRGCTWAQWDLDNDGVPNALDSKPFNDKVGSILGGQRFFNQYGDGRIPLTQTEYSELEGINYIDVGRIYGTEDLNAYTSDEFQLKNDATTYKHEFTDEFFVDGELICQSTISARQFLGKIDDFNTHEILKLNYTSQNSEQSCSQIGDGLKASHLGKFGDFDGNGIIDFVNGYSDFENKIYHRCELYLGVTENPVSFSDPIILGDSDSESEGHNDRCKNGNDMNPIGIIIADVDNDGFDDIVTDTGIIFVTDDGYQFTTPLWLAGFIGHVIDFDDDGDLDILAECFPNNGDICQGNIAYNYWYPDSDNDGIRDSEDICPGHPDSEDWDKDMTPDGCDSDDDNDGTPDVDDLCPYTPTGALVDWGCPMDWDEDGVYDGLDLCPESVGYGGVDEDGCDLDSDDDGIPDFDDQCPQTPIGYEVDYMGCIIENHDFDKDGVPDVDDEFPDNWQEWSDSDGDGVGDNADAFPTDPSKWSAEDDGGIDQKSDSSESNTVAGIIGTIFCFGMLGAFVLVVIKLSNSKSKLRQETALIPLQPIQQTYVPVPQISYVPVPQISYVPVPQISSREKELETRSNAAIQREKELEKELADSVIANMQLKDEIEQVKIQRNESIILQDSVVGGDIVASGGQKIENQTNISGIDSNLMEKLLDRERQNADETARLREELARLKKERDE